MYHISLYFDNKSQGYISKLIKNVAMSSGNTFVYDRKIEPHITIAIIQSQLDKEAYININEQLKQRILSNTFKCGQIDVCSIGCFKPNVLFLQPIYNDYLIRINQVISNILINQKCSEMYKPTIWLPHISIAKGLNEIQMRSAFSNLYANFNRFDAEVACMGLKDTKGMLPEYRYNLSR